MSHPVKNAWQSHTALRAQLLSLVFWALQSGLDTLYAPLSPQLPGCAMVSHSWASIHVPPCLNPPCDFHLPFKCRCRHHFLHEFFHDLLCSSWGSANCPSKVFPEHTSLLVAHTKWHWNGFLFVDLFRQSICSFRDYILPRSDLQCTAFWKTARVLT